MTTESPVAESCKAVKEQDDARLLLDEYADAVGNFLLATKKSAHLLALMALYAGREYQELRRLDKLDKLETVTCPKS